MSTYPFGHKEIDWQRPRIERDVLKQCTRRSDLQGLWHCLGILGILTVSGSTAYYFYATQQWLWMALALYIHGGLFAFNPQTHEFSHGTVFRSKWLNRLFQRIFGILHWNSNSALYKMSHMRHHRYTTHHGADGEVVLPMPRTKEQVFREALHVVDLNRFIDTVIGTWSGTPSITPWPASPATACGSTTAPPVTTGKSRRRGGRLARNGRRRKTRSGADIFLTNACRSLILITGL